MYSSTEYGEGYWDTPQASIGILERELISDMNSIEQPSETSAKITMKAEINVSYMAKTTMNDLWATIYHTVTQQIFAK